VPNINQVVVAMAKKGHSVSAGKVREVATEEGIELARNVRLQQAPAVLKLAKQLRKEGWPARSISHKIETQLGVEVSPHYVNTLIRRSAK
jgi:Flp pilus assembly protein TadD